MIQPGWVMVNATAAIWGIATLSIGGVILRPWRIPEALSAGIGALALVALGLIPVNTALLDIAKGIDVYLFLIGMMLLAEVARQEGLFDWLAAYASSLAHGSALRLFALLYIAGIVVTVFLSNDATAVVLTPAVAAVARTAKVERPLPYLLICAFIANAASFVLPISNPANLVIYGNDMPPLLMWLKCYGLASMMSIGVTYVLLYVTQRRALHQPLVKDVTRPTLTVGGQMAALGIAVAAIVLILASAFGQPLGLPTCLAGLGTVLTVLVFQRTALWPLLRDISWGVLPLVAGLFVLVEALGETGFISAIADLLRQEAARSVSATAWGAGILLGFACNIMNNLPAGLLAGSAVQAAQTHPAVTNAMVIGVDLGPNLSVTGSLATILWLGALRREGIAVGAWDFLKLGLLVMPLPLLLSLAGLMLVS